MKKIVRVVSQDVFISFDGIEFSDIDDCLCHEDELNQERIEKETFDKLGIKMDSEFPSMIDRSHNPEMKMFLIKNETDLDIFIKAYEYWFTRLVEYPQVDKLNFIYPDVLCLLDFPQGDEEYRLYKMSSLCRKSDVFFKELNKYFLL